MNWQAPTPRPQTGNPPARQGWGWAARARALGMIGAFLLTACAPDLPPNPPTGHVPSGQFYHYLRYGENLDQIARRYYRSPQRIIEANNMTPPYQVYEGYRLIIPPLRIRSTPSPPRGARPPLGPAPEPVSAAPGPSRPRYTQPIVPIQPLSPAPPQTPTISGIAVRAEDLRQTSRSGFRWPLAGTVIRLFQTDHTAPFYGVAIQAPRGAPVRAAKDGTILAVGPVIGGYGDMVVIAHARSYYTIYGNLDAIRVQPQQKIAAGQTLGIVGQDIPAPDVPHLHFQIRHRDKALNPLSYLPKP